MSETLSTKRFLTALARTTASISIAQLWTPRPTPPKAGEATGPNPTDRGRAGSKRHVITDANTADSRVIAEMTDAVPRTRQSVGRPRKRLAKLHADEGYDYERCPKGLRKRRISDRIAREGIETSQKLGQHRWVVERSIAWLFYFRRLTIRYDRRADIHEAFPTIATALIVLRFFQHWFC